jgi:hypothetical protein
MGNVFTCSAKLKLSDDFIIAMNADETGIGIKLLDVLPLRHMYSKDDKAKIDSAVLKYLNVVQLDKPPPLVRQNAVSQL